MSIAPSKQKSLPTLALELKDLVVAYAKQETIVPIKALGRFVMWGVLGSAVLCIGLLLLSLGLLRALQVELDTTFDGSLAWVPYLITLVACGVGAVLAVRAIGAARRRADERSARATTGGRP